MFRTPARVSLSRVTYRVSSDYTFADESLADRVFTTPGAAWRAAAADYLHGDNGETPETVADVVRRLTWRADAGEGFDGDCPLGTGETITVHDVAPADACTRDTLNGRVEFDCPFRVWPGGVVTDGPLDVHSPEGAWDDVAPDGWEFATAGYTRQYGYRGPTMHSSEFLGGVLAEDILAEPSVYVLTKSHVTPDDDDDDDDSDTVAGWVVLRLGQS